MSMLPRFGKLSLLPAAGSVEVVVAVVTAVVTVILDLSGKIYAPGAYHAKPVVRNTAGL